MEKKLIKKHVLLSNEADERYIKTVRNSIQQY